MHKSEKGRRKRWKKNLATFQSTRYVTVQAMTGLAPCELSMKRQLRTRLDVMRPRAEETVRQRTAYRSSQQTKESNEPDLVSARNDREGDQSIPERNDNLRIVLSVEKLDFWI